MKLSRREILFGSLALGSISKVINSQSKSTQYGSITDVSGIRVGHFTDKRRPTGCTVVLCESGAVAGVDIRGAAPGTRETDLLDPKNLVQKIHAIVLSGGSAFGLDAATGVMKYLEEKDIGYDVGVAKVPIVPAAILFDLSVGNAKIRPDALAGYQACLNASKSSPSEGNVGAGAGATVGKFFGMSRAMKSGIGSASLKTSDGITVGAIVAVNAVGDIFDPINNNIIAGVRSSDGKRVLGTLNAIKKGEKLPALLGGMNTTIGVIATDAELDKAQCQKVAQMTHDGLARTINPVHTMYDGDSIFAVATGTSKMPANVSMIGIIAGEVIARAVVSAVNNAQGIDNLPSLNDLRKL